MSLVLNNRAQKYSKVLHSKGIGKIMAMVVFRTNTYSFKQKGCTFQRDSPGTALSSETTLKIELAL